MLLVSATNVISMRWHCEQCCLSSINVVLPAKIAKNNIWSSILGWLPRLQEWTRDASFQKPSHATPSVSWKADRLDQLKATLVIFVHFLQCQFFMIENSISIHVVHLGAQQQHLAWMILGLVGIAIVSFFNTTWNDIWSRSFSSVFVLCSLPNMHWHDSCWPKHNFLIL